MLVYTWLIKTSKWVVHCDKILLGAYQFLGYFLDSMWDQLDLHNSFINHMLWFCSLDYSFERETGGLRRIAGYGVTVTRGAASAMMFTYCSLLITMSRNMITFFRETFLHRFFPWDSMHALHKFIAYQALFSTCKGLTSDISIEYTLILVNQLLLTYFYLWIAVCKQVNDY